MSATLQSQSKRIELEKALKRLDTNALKYLKRAELADSGKIATAPVILLLALLMIAVAGSKILSCVSFVLGIPIFWFFLALDEESRAQLEAIRNQRAPLVLRALEAGLIPSYSLYVRPFQTDGRISESFTSQWGRVEQDLEKGFANALEPIAPLIGLAYHHKTWGVGRIVSGRNWQDIFGLLLEHAFCVIAVPFPVGSVAMELEMILQSAQRHRTVFVMPSRKRNWPSRVQWEAVHARLVQIGLKQSTTYRNSLGYMFSIDETGNRVGSALLPTSGWRGLRKDILNLLSKNNGKNA